MIPDYKPTPLTLPGFYLYIEASGRDPLDEAVLSSGSLQMPGSQYCLRFWYHLYGQHIGTLAVEAVANTGAVTRVWAQGSVTSGGKLVGSSLKVDGNIIIICAFVLLF